MSARITIDSKDLVRAEQLVEPETLVKMLVKETYRYDETDDVLEKRCSTCREYWPADSEFFFTMPASYDGLHCMCKACVVESRAAA